MAEVQVTENELAGRDAALARYFEQEIRAAAGEVPQPASGPLKCRILAWQRRLDLGSRQMVTVMLMLPGWVKALAVPISPMPGQVRTAAAAALRLKLLPVAP